MTGTHKLYTVYERHPHEQIQPALISETLFVKIHYKTFSDTLVCLQWSPWFPTSTVSVYMCTHNIHCCLSSVLKCKFSRRYKPLYNQDRLKAEQNFYQLAWIWLVYISCKTPHLTPLKWTVGPCQQLYIWLSPLVLLLVKSCLQSFLTKCHFICFCV